MNALSRAPARGRREARSDERRGAIRERRAASVRSRGCRSTLKEEVPVEGVAHALRLARDRRDRDRDGADRRAHLRGRAPSCTPARRHPSSACTGYTHSKLWGVTRNPWNPEVAVGGSSGGAGASLASGHVAARRAAPTSAGRSGIPASINGVVGFKPPHGRVPTGAPYNLDRYLPRRRAGPHDRRLRALRERRRGPAPGRHRRRCGPNYKIRPALDGVDGLRGSRCRSTSGSWEVERGGRREHPRGRRGPDRGRGRQGRRGRRSRGTSSC